MISRKDWRDIIGVQFNPKILYFFSLFVKRKWNKKKTTKITPDQTPKFTRLLLLCLLIAKAVEYDGKVGNRKTNSNF